MQRNAFYDRAPWDLHQDPRGLDGWAEWYREGHAAQVLGLGKYVDRAIEGILANSANPPIIIVQGDHGPRLGLTENVETSDVEERMAILNAFYLPGIPQKKLYPQISSVNTFRFIFNEYFGQNYPLLDDRSYFSYLGLNMIEVTERISPDPSSL